MSSATFFRAVTCYLDDIVGEDMVFQSKFVGELLAVEEFNDRNSSRKIAQINGLAQKRTLPAGWKREHRSRSSCSIIRSTVSTSVRPKRVSKLPL